MEQTDPVPGLGRGLAILAHLGREGACSLERIAKDLQYPKSSSARILESLMMAGCVLRDPLTKRFRACRILVAAPGAGGDLRQAVGPDAAALATATGASVEVYAWHAGRLVMIDRADPEAGDVVVWARVGWVRPRDELDCLNRIACAHGGQACARSWILDASGKRITLDVATVRREVAAARDQAVVADASANGRGVFRVASPLIAEGALVGILALASPASQPPQVRSSERLAETAAAISRRLSSMFTSQGIPA